MKAVSVEDFIKDANNYAQGKASILASDDTATTKKRGSLKGLNKNSTKLYRHATFSLSQTCINQLTALAQQTQLPKSRLVRILIDEFSHKSPDEQQTLITRHQDKP